MCGFGEIYLYIVSVAMSMYAASWTLLPMYVQAFQMILNDADEKTYSPVRVAIGASGGTGSLVDMGERDGAHKNVSTDKEEHVDEQHEQGRRFGCNPQTHKCVFIVKNADGDELWARDGESSLTSDPTFLYSKFGFGDVQLLGKRLYDGTRTPAVWMLQSTFPPYPFCPRPEAHKGNFKLSLFLCEPKGTIVDPLPARATNATGSHGDDDDPFGRFR